MRLAWPPPWHLIVSVLIPVIALALVHLSPPSLQGILSLPALIFVLLIPGYLATLSLFPGKSDLCGHRRIFLCLAFSAMLAGLFSFILTATPRGLQSSVFSHNSLSSGHITGGGGLWPLVESAPQEKISSFAKERTGIGAGLSPHFPGKHHEQACRSGYLPVGGLFYSCPGFCLWLISEFFRRSDHKA